MDTQTDTNEAVYTLCEEVGLPATIEQMKNPTEEVIVNNICAFFRDSYIDVATIIRLTLEQVTALDVTGQENAPIAPLLNLQETMAAIGPGIFINDFHIGDITAPRRVRTKKHLKFIANFMLYVRNKKANLQTSSDEVLGRATELQNLRKEKEEMVEKMNSTVRDTAHKQSEIDRLEREAKEREAKLCANRMIIEQKDKVVKEAAEIKTQNVAKIQMKRVELQRLQDISDQLNAKIVKSPDKVISNLRNLEEERKNQEEQRELIQQGFVEKKANLQKYESALTIINKELSRLKEVSEKQKKVNAAQKESERLKGEIEEAIRVIKLEEKLGSKDDQLVAAEEIQQCERDCQERLEKLQKICSDLDVEKKGLERKKVHLETRYTELYSETSKIRGKITEGETQNGNFLKQCQELYDSEMAKMEKLHKMMEFEGTK